MAESFISTAISDVLPWITTGLTSGIPGLALKAAGLVTNALGLTDTSVAAAQTALANATPEQQITLQQAELTFKLQMQQAGYQNAKDLATVDLQKMQTVNQTMQVELSNSANETWYEKGWRPACGFSVAIGSLCGVLGAVVLTYQGIANHDGNALAAIPGLASSLAIILGVPGAAVGIAAWHRGVQQVKATEGATQVAVVQAQNAGGN